ncbi:MAG: FAD-dependent oxidoreductase, partial [Porticoccaceae bacterium]|nr:FAD-dependent oxidoreductase [Porticoccaceae bacterium]
SKAMIHAATRFEELGKHFKEPHMGISIASQPQLDMAAVVAWKDGIVKKLTGGIGQLLKKARVERVQGWARFRDGKTCDVETADGTVTIEAEHVILANGSTSTELPFMPYGGNVISSTEALQLTEVPQNLVVVGAGYIGLEMGMAMRKLGASVTFVEALDRILPIYDKEMTRPIEMWLKKYKVEVNLQAKAKGVVEKNGKNYLQYVDREGNEQEVLADKILVTVGRKANTQGWGLENMCVDMDGPFVKVDNQCRTSMKNVWAIGDLVGEPLLAHKASAQGEMVAEIIAGERRLFDPVAIPAVCFTEPEICGIGLTPDEANAEGIEVISGKFPFAASGRALAMDAGSDGGFV